MGAGLSADLDRVYDALLAMHGPQRWWPHAAADGDAEGAALEICIGALLVQHTAWRGAEQAIAGLREAGALSLGTLAALPEERLGALIRPAGTYRAKARALHAFAQAALARGTVRALLDGEPADVRARLLAIRGVGPETADAMLLYAAGRPAFVVDGYARRLFARLGVAGLDADGEALLRAAGTDVERLREWHALIVRHGQRLCRARAPRCEECALRTRCAFGQAKARRAR